MGKFTEFLFSGVPYNELTNVYKDIVDFKNKNIKINHRLDPKEVTVIMK